MKCKPVKETDTGEVNCNPEEATHIWLHMPGPFYYRRIPVCHGNVKRKGKHCWSWNGDVDKPTLKPSILTRANGVVCHSFVNDGFVKFLGDCTHDLVNKEVELYYIEA